MGETSLKRAREWIDPLLGSLLDLLFPRRCAGCGRPGEVWCLRCQSQLEIFPQARCQHCGRNTRGMGVYCGPCLEALAHPPILSYARYRQPLRRALLSLKYRADMELAGIMAGWLRELWLGSGWEATMVVPVPLSPKRYRKRGYNQADLLASALAELIGIEHRTDVLWRSRETGSQVGLDYQQRWRNVAGAFQANAEKTAGDRVLLVDDLYTTGSTLTACAEAFTNADDVFGITVAKA
ncbi:MAG: double zinc ribbon domain-containing protein [Anaerolineales bacterium]